MYDHMLCAAEVKILFYTFNEAALQYGDLVLEPLSHALT